MSLSEKEIDAILLEKRRQQKREWYHRNKQKIKDDPVKLARRQETNRKSWHNNKDKYNAARRKNNEQNKNTRVTKTI